jgi:hypothetical protein
LAPIIIMLSSLAWTGTAIAAYAVPAVAAAAGTFLRIANASVMLRIALTSSQSLSI